MASLLPDFWDMAMRRCRIRHAIDVPRNVSARLGACHDTPLQLADARYSVGIRGRFWYDDRQNSLVLLLDFGIKEKSHDLRNA